MRIAHRNVASISGAMLGLTLLAVTTTTSHAALIASDSFAVAAGGDDYAIGALYNQSPTVGTTGFSGSAAWANATGANIATSGGLTHTLLAGTALEGRYQPIASTSAAAGAYRNVHRVIDYTPTTGTYYMSVLIRPTVIGGLATKDGLLGISSLQAAGTSLASTTGVLIGIDGDATGGDIAIVTGGSSTTVVDSTNLTANETYFGLVQIDFSTTALDSVIAKIYNAAGSMIGTQTVTGLNLDASMGYFTAISGDSFYTVGIHLDEFRFGTALSDVMAVTVPAPAALPAGLALIALATVRRRVRN